MGWQWTGHGDDWQMLHPRHPSALGHQRPSKLQKIIKISDGRALMLDAAVVARALRA